MSRQLSNWLEHYLKFTEESEPPTIYHVWSGITAISSMLQRKCFTNWGLIGYTYPNLYVCLVGPPGGRKGTAMKIAKAMVQEMNIAMGSDALGSTQILYKEIIDSQQNYLTFDGKEVSHKSLSVWSEEFQVLLSDKDPRLISSLTDLFDCPAEWSYNTLKRDKEKLSNCWLTIIGAITPSLLQSKLTSDAVGGGLLSRIILAVGYGPRRRKAFQFLSKEDLELQSALLHDLEQILLLTGPFNLSQDFLNAYGPWYENEMDTQGMDDDKFVGYISRKSLHIRKLCMIISAAESDEMIITSEHFRRALSLLEWTEEEMPNAFFGLGSGRHNEVYSKFLRWSEAQSDFNETDVIKKFQLDAMPQELINMISLAERAGMIRIERSTVTNKTRYHPVLKPVNRTQALQYLKRTLFSKMTITP